MNRAVGGGVGGWEGEPEGGHPPKICVRCVPCGFTMKQKNVTCEIVVGKKVGYSIQLLG